MASNTLKRTVLLIVTSLSHGLLLAWVLTFDQGSLDQLMASFSIGGLLLFAHYSTSKILDRSILIIHSYLEGFLLFIMTMAAFRLGDHYLGITSISIRTEIFLFSVAALSGLTYVWAMRRVYPPQKQSEESS